MSKKRSNRNSKKVLKALRQKRANGGRLKSFEGGRFDINDEYIREQIESQRQQGQPQATVQPVTTQPSGPGGGSVTVGVAPPQSIESAPTRDTGSVTVPNTPTTTPTTIVPTGCLLYTSPSPRDGLLSRMPSSA